MVEAGLTEDGWVPVDPPTLRTRFEDVYAVGDVTSVGTPKAGVFAEGQASVVAAQLIARVRGGSAAAYDGHGTCYLEFGGGEVGKVDVTFLSGQAPTGALEGPSLALAADKAAFGADRVRRWFGTGLESVAGSRQTSRRRVRGCRLAPPQARGVGCQRDLSGPGRRHPHRGRCCG